MPRRLIADPNTALRTGFLLIETGGAYHSPQARLILA